MFVTVSWCDLACRRNNVFMSLSVICKLFMIILAVGLHKQLQVVVTDIKHLFIVSCTRSKFVVINKQPVCFTSVSIWLFLYQRTDTYIHIIYVRTYVRTYIYIYIVPVLTYNMGTWGLTPTEWARFDGFQTSAEAGHWHQKP